VRGPELEEVLEQWRSWLKKKQPFVFGSLWRAVYTESFSPEEYIQVWMIVHDLWQAQFASEAEILPVIPAELVSALWLNHIRFVEDPYEIHEPWVDIRINRLCWSVDERLRFHIRCVCLHLCHLMVLGSSKGYLRLDT